MFCNPTVIGRHRKLLVLDRGIKVFEKDIRNYKQHAHHLEVDESVSDSLTSCLVIGMVTQNR